jgi:hypothetical protein
MVRVPVPLACWITAAAVALVGPRGAVAQDTTASVNHLYDKFQVQLAFAMVTDRSDVRVDASDGSFGTTLSFGDILGISGASAQPAIGLRWKPGRRTEFDLGYQFLNSSGENSIDTTLVIGDDILSGDIDLKSDLRSDDASFQFKYSIWAKDKVNAGLAIGFGAILFDMKFDGTAGACSGSNCVDSTLSVHKKFTGPTATLGAFGQWRVGDRWYVGADARGIVARVDRFDFSIFEGNLGGQYFLSNRWGLGLSWYYTDVSVGIEDIEAPSDAAADDLIGKVTFSYSSIRLGVVGAF